MQQADSASFGLQGFAGGTAAAAAAFLAGQNTSTASATGTFGSGTPMLPDPTPLPSAPIASAPSASSESVSERLMGDLLVSDLLASLDALTLPTL